MGAIGQTTGKITTNVTLKGGGFLITLRHTDCHFSADSVPIVEEEPQDYGAGRFQWQISGGFTLAQLTLVMIETAFCTFSQSVLRKKQSKKFSMFSINSAFDGSDAPQSQSY